MGRLDRSLKSQESSASQTLQRRGIDYRVLSQEILQVLRGSITQRELSRRLGYSFNQVGKWESGVTKLKWVDFVSIAEILKIPLKEHCIFYFAEDSSDIDIDNISIQLQHSHALIDLNCKEISVKLKRWQLGRYSPYFSDVLEFFDSRPTSLLGWLMLFLDCSELPSVCTEYQHLTALLKATSDEPLLIYINAALKLQVYLDSKIHDEALLSRHAVVSIPRLRTALKKLISLDAITFDGRKYHSCPFDFSFSNLRHRDLRKFNKYTTLLAGDMYPLHPLPQNTFVDNNRSKSSVRVNAISKEAADKIDILVSQFHGEVSEIVKNDVGKKNNVQIVLLHSFASNLLPSNNPDLIEEMCLSNLPGKDTLSD